MPRPIRIMPMGDSCTAGFTDNPGWSVPFRYGYRETLYRLLDSRFHGRFTYVGASPQPRDKQPGYGDPDTYGHSSRFLDLIGQNNHRGYTGVGYDFLTGYLGGFLVADEPDVILLMSGVNDIQAGASADPVVAKGGLQTLVQTMFLYRPSITVIVGQIIPKSVDTPAVPLYNAFIRDTLVPAQRALGRACYTVDHYTAILNGAANTSAALFSNAVNHPQPSGYDRMALAWFAALEGILRARIGRVDAGVGMRIGSDIAARVT